MDRIDALCREGLFLLLIWPVRDRQCTCGLPTAKCRGPGKHPRFSAGRYTEHRWSASNDPEIVRRMLADAPGCGLGIATEESGLVVLDLDSAAAIEWWSALGHDTRTVETGKGLHAYYRAPEGVSVKNSVGVLAPGVDTRARGGYVVAPGSRHRSGVLYEWTDPSVTIAPLPAELLEKIRAAGLIHERRAAPALPLVPPSPGVSAEAVRRAEEMAREIEDRPFPGPIRDKLNALVYRLGRYAAAGALDPDWIRTRFVQALRVKDPDDLYLAKNIEVINVALDDASDDPDLPRGAAGVTLTFDDLATLARPAACPGIVKAALRAAAKGDVLAERDHLDEALRRTGAWIARRMPDADPASVDGLFAASVALTSRRVGVDLPVDCVSRAVSAALDRSRAKQEGEPWRTSLACTKEGQPKTCTANAIVVFTGHPDVAGALQRDTFLQRDVYVRDVPWAKAGDEVTDAHTLAALDWAHKACGVQFEPHHVHHALEMSAAAHPCDSLRDYLTGLRWDGIPRIDMWLVSSAGAPDTDYTRWVSSKWLISAVARALAPGCQADHALVLEGDQGRRKSTLIQALMPVRDWFTDRLGDIETKEGAEQLGGRWVVEMAEMQALKKKEVEAIKAYLTRRVDTYRPAYGRRVQSVPRRVVFIGTTNDDTYLADGTGARRFWPLKITKCDVSGVEHVRDQLWAEAVVRYMAGQKWWLDEEQEAVARVEQAARDTVAEEPWLPILAKELEGKTGPYTSSDLLLICGVAYAAQRGGNGVTLKRVMTALGWKSKLTNKGRVWVSDPGSTKVTR